MLRAELLTRTDGTRNTARNTGPTLECDRIISTNLFAFLPERDYVTFGSLLLQIRLSVGL